MFAHSITNRKLSPNLEQIQFLTPLETFNEIKSKFIFQRCPGHYLIKLANEQIYIVRVCKKINGPESHPESSVTRKAVLGGQK